MITPGKGKTLCFLQEKITEIGTAICYNVSAALVKLPTSVVHVLEVDEEGQIWFLLPRPAQLPMGELEAHFPVQLDFHKKGASCTLQVAGVANLVPDPKIIRRLRRKSTGNRSFSGKLIAIRVKMIQVQYYNRATQEKKSFFQMLSHWIQQIWNVEPHSRNILLQQPNN